MPEQRGRKYHQERVGGNPARRNRARIEGELSDPRISFAYISQVVSQFPAGKSALILCGRRWRCTGRSRYPGRPDGGARLHPVPVAGAQWANASCPT